jgi:hypothetical protein
VWNIIHLESTSIVASWWSQWVVMAACYCYLWWCSWSDMSLVTLIRLWLHYSCHASSGFAGTDRTVPFNVVVEIHWQSRSYLPLECFSWVVCCVSWSWSENAPVVLIWHPLVPMLSQQQQYQVHNLWMLLFSWIARVINGNAVYTCGLVFLCCPC